ncbi:MAG: hypothetical protein WC159_13755, partial [Sphaerochaetaceae bacterium]
SSNISGGGAITFTDLNEEIPANESVRYYVTASFVKDSAQDGETVKFEVTTASVEDIDGKTVSVVASTPLVSTRTITIKGTGTLDVDMDNNNTATKDNTYQLAGTQDVAVASVKMKATNEDVKITKLNFFADAVAPATLSDDEMVQNISEIALYDGTTKVAYTNNIAKTSQVTGLSLVIPQTEKTYTIKVKLNEYGKDKTAVLAKDIKFSLAVVEAQGDVSGDDLNVEDIDTAGEVGWSKAMGITATKLSAVSMVNSYSGINVASSLSTASDNNAAIIKVTAPSYGNNTTDTGTEIKTLLNNVRVKIAGNAHTDGADVKIQRIGGSGQTYNVASAAGYANFSTAGWEDVDKEVAAGQEAYFLVKVTTLAFEANTSYTLQIVLDALNGVAAESAYSFSWQETGDDDAIAPKYDLRIPGVISIDGNQITN